MNSQYLYQQDVTILEFEAVVADRFILPDGRIGVALDHTYFYPTGGGQEHDTGHIDSAKVVDVYKDDANSRLVHVVEGEVSAGPVKVCIDADRRLRHMQHHTAQHLLTQCLLRQTGYETVSANINGDSPSTLDIVATEISKPDMEAAELQANRIIYEDRIVKTYFVTPDELQSIPLRRPPKVTENIRIVEIDKFDYSPCGGTHVLHTGSIGLVKALKTERQNDKLRIYFVAGLQAFDTFSQMYDLFSGLANLMSTTWQDIPAVLIKQTEQLNTLQKDLMAIKQASIKYEARDLVEGADGRSGFRLVRKSYEGRPVSELRLMAEVLKRIPDLVSFLATYDGLKISLIVTCGEVAGKDARQLLNKQLALIQGRGGGDARLAQGGGAANNEQFHTFLDQIDLV
jgi:alanyl-tRNA synthetase